MFTIKTSNSVRIEGMYLNITKAIFDKSRTNITLNDEKLKVFPLRSEMRQGCLRSSPVFTMVLEVLGIKQENIKGIQTENDEVK